MLVQALSRQQHPPALHVTPRTPIRLSPAKEKVDLPKLPHLKCFLGCFVFFLKIHFFLSPKQTYKKLGGLLIYFLVFICKKKGRWLTNKMLC